MKIHRHPNIAVPITRNRLRRSIEIGRAIARGTSVHTNSPDMFGRECRRFGRGEYQFLLVFRPRNPCHRVSHVDELAHIGSRTDIHGGAYVTVAESRQLSRYSEPPRVLRPGDGRYRLQFGTPPAAVASTW
jgi:hypothetical protein